MTSLHTNPSHYPTMRGNLLLRSLTAQDAQFLSPYLTRVHFTPGDVVAAPDKHSTAAYFPETAILCFREALSSPSRPVVGLVGQEGMIGWSLLMGCPPSLIASVDMHGGSALAIPADKLIEACRHSASLNVALLRFAHNFIAQMACTIASTAFDTIERRVARWLLMVHDRTEGDSMELTHDHIGGALHVRRASVTDCLHMLEGELILRCTRGRVLVRDRARLEAIAGTSYG
ncbi:MAG: Crp/Fnr family transcriptional regulator, partial [Sphingomonadales bacterium]